MKVLFIVPYPIEGPSSRFRVQQYLPYLEENGIEYGMRPFCSSYLYRILFKRGYYVRKIFFVLFFLFKRIGDVISAFSYDAIFIHREAYPFDGYILEGLFKLTGRKIIFDFDDSVFIKKPLKTKKALSIADSVIAGNDFLERYALSYNKRVVVLPTCIETKVYKPNPGPADDKVIVGWIGTSFTAVYLELLKDVYDFLSLRYKNVEFKIIGGRLKTSNPAVICKKWSLESELPELQSFDIGVMPLFDDEMTRGKCGFKIIQYMAVGVPSVASAVGVNVQLIEDGKEGFLVSTKQEWINKLSILIENRHLREDMGKLARQKAEKLYSIDANKEKFIAVLREVCNLR